MSAAGHWDHSRPISYGQSTTYELAAAWLAPCAVVEDWGAGTGRFATYRDGVTIGVDGSPSPPPVNTGGVINMGDPSDMGDPADMGDLGNMSMSGDLPAIQIVTALEDYTSDVPAIHMRHVLEHNRTWRTILTNACQSFTERMALTLFTPLADHDHELAWVDSYSVPDLALSAPDLYAILDTHDITHQSMSIQGTEAGYGQETMICMTKQPDRPANRTTKRETRNRKPKRAKR